MGGVDDQRILPDHITLINRFRRSVEWQVWRCLPTRIRQIGCGAALMDALSVGPGLLRKLMVNGYPKWPLLHVKWTRYEKPWIFLLGTVYQSIPKMGYSLSCIQSQVPGSISRSSDGHHEFSDLIFPVHFFCPSWNLQVWHLRFVRTHPFLQLSNLRCWRTAPPRPSGWGWTFFVVKSIHNIQGLFIFFSACELSCRSWIRSSLWYSNVAGWRIPIYPNTINAGLNGRLQQSIQVGLSIAMFD